MSLGVTFSAETLVSLDPPTQFSVPEFTFAAAWIVLTIYVLMMVGREGRLKREIANLKAMLEERQKK